jgi:hypothetical protein
VDKFTQRHIHTRVDADRLDKIRFTFNHVVEHLLSLQHSGSIPLVTDNVVAQSGEFSTQLDLQSGDTIVAQSGQISTQLDLQSGDVDVYEDDDIMIDMYSDYEVNWGEHWGEIAETHSQSHATKWYNAVMKWCRCCVKCCLDTLTSLPRIQSYRTASQ